jgi:fructokinase
MTNMGPVNRIGVDLGGTKIEAVALAPRGEEVLRHRVPTPAGDYEATVRAIVDLVEQVERRAGPTVPTIGIGAPGAISPLTGLLKNSNSTALNGMPLDRDLAAALGRPLVMRNDADCFALSEALDGAGAGARVVFGVILGTGVGGGIVVDGRPLRGPNGLTGEWGHNPLPWPRPDELPGMDCYCGLTGCIETYLAGSWLEVWYRKETGEDLPAPEIVDAARAGSTEAGRVLNDYYDRTARALATVINLLDPDVIVLGGGMSNVDEIYREVPRRWGDYVFGREVLTPLLKNRWGDSSGVRGAAWLVEG